MNQPDKTSTNEKNPESEPIAKPRDPEHLATDTSDTAQDQAYAADKKSRQEDPVHARVDDTLVEPPELNDEGSGNPLLRELEKAQAKAEENNDRYLRAVADLENYRKRMIREKEELRKYGAAPFIEDLMPAIDNLALGLAAAENHPEAKPVTKGFALVITQIKEILMFYRVG